MTETYPRGPITPHGWYHLVRGEVPLMWLDAYDESCRFHLMGGYAIPTPEDPEAVHLKGLKGLIPPWKHIDQKGASEDGVTQVDALYEPIEAELSVEIRGRDAVHTRAVDRALLGSIDAKDQSNLHFHTPDAGHWWAPIRWFKGAPTEQVRNPNEHRVLRTLRLRADSGLWRTDEDFDSFAPSYESMTDSFNYDTSATQDLGADWPLNYNGPGGGYVYADGDRARWRDDPDDPLLTHTREVVIGPKKDFETDTDNQIVTMVIGDIQEFSLPKGAANDLWGRMGRNPDGSWDGSGIRLRMENNIMKLSYFIGGVQTVMFQRIMPLPPLWGEKFSLLCGANGNPRKFVVQRNGLPVLTHVEKGTGSPLGPANRGIGFGMQAAAAIITQATPASIRKVSGGDNKAVTQSGFLARRNPGDQPMYDDYTLFGPFNKVRIWDGPGAGTNDYVEFGPLLAGQIVFLRTDPRSQTTLVQDLTADPLPTAAAGTFADALDKFLTFAGMNGAFGDQIKSLFGIKAPQGNLYRYLSGRFSDRYAIPKKSPGNPVQTYHVRVELEGGDAESKVIVAGTPLRRNPI